MLTYYLLIVLSTLSFATPIIQKTILQKDFSTKNLIKNTPNKYAALNELMAIFESVAEQHLNEENKKMNQFLKNKVSESFSNCVIFFQLKNLFN